MKTAAHATCCYVLVYPTRFRLLVIAADFWTEFYCYLEAAEAASELVGIVRFLDMFVGHTRCDEDRII